MLLILIVIILIFSAMDDLAEASEYKASQRAAERRHRELMEATERSLLKKRKTTEYKKITRRRIIKDKHGNILAEEIIVDTDDE